MISTKQRGLDICCPNPIDIPRLLWAFTEARIEPSIPKSIIVTLIPTYDSYIARKHIQTTGDLMPLKTLFSMLWDKSSYLVYTHIESEVIDQEGFDWEHKSDHTGIQWPLMADHILSGPQVHRPQHLGMSLSPGGLIKRPSTIVLTNIGIIKWGKSCQQLTENKKCYSKLDDCTIWRLLREDFQLQLVFGP